MVAVRQAHRAEPAPQSAVQTRLPHQARHPHATAGLAVVEQPTGDARAAVGLAAGVIGFGNQRQQSRIGLCPLAGRTLRPSVVAAGRHGQRGAQHVDGVFVAHGFHTLKSLPDGVAMMPSVFLECPAAAPDGAPPAATGGSPLRAGQPNAAPGRWPASRFLQTRRSTLQK